MPHTLTSKILRHLTRSTSSNGLERVHAERVVDEAVEPAERVDRAVDERLHLRPASTRLVGTASAAPPRRSISACDLRRGSRRCGRRARRWRLPERAPGRWPGPGPAPRRRRSRPCPGAACRPSEPARGCHRRPRRSGPAVTRSQRHGGAQGRRRDGSMPSSDDGHRRTTSRRQGPRIGARRPWSTPRTPRASRRPTGDDQDASAGVRAKAATRNRSCSRATACRWTSGRSCTSCQQAADRYRDDGGNDRYSASTRATSTSSRPTAGNASVRVRSASPARTSRARAARSARAAACRSRDRTRSDPTRRRTAR